MLQNKLLKVLTNQNFRTPTNELHKSLDILKVKDILTRGSYVLYTTLLTINNQLFLITILRNLLMYKTYILEIKINLSSLSTELFLGAKL